MKKRTKKLLSVSRSAGVAACGAGAAGNGQKFFGSFFQKRTSSFLSADRLRAWAIVPLGAMALWVGIAAVEAALGINGVRAFLGADFTCYWAAGELARHGMAASVYDTATLSAAEHAARDMPASAGLLPFYYPPPYLLMCAALACMPYWLAVCVFLGTGLAMLIAALRRLVPAGTGLLPILAFPGLVVSARTGQNGVLSAACFAWFAALADTRPWLAGACLGILACKPQLAVCAPLALLAAGRWRSIAAAALTFLALCLLSVAAFGLAPWSGFFHHLGAASDNITVGIQDRAKIMSAFNTARLLGAGLRAAGLVQAAVSLPALAALLWFARRRPDGAALGGALAAAALLVTPYLMDYDLVALAPALAAGARLRVLAGEKLCLIAGFLLPLMAHDLAQRTGLQIAPVVMAGVLFVLVRPRVAVAA